MEVEESISGTFNYYVFPPLSLITIFAIDELSKSVASGITEWWSKSLSIKAAPKYMMLLLYNSGTLRNTIKQGGLNLLMNI